MKKILIVGGGTAGWLTAAKLARTLSANSPEGVQVTLVESSDIPTIGVGEGTWPTMRKTLASIGIDEATFLNRTDASFKQGTKFVNWHQPPIDGVNQHYYHAFTSILDSAELNLTPYWYKYSEGQSYADTISVQPALSEAGLSPKLITNRPYEGLQNYAYHLDAGKLVELLKEHAQQQLGVKHLIANVVQVHSDETGIASVDTDNAGRLIADLYIDCTGFEALLIGKSLGVKFCSIKDQLLVDQAIAIQVPYESAEQDIASATISTAQSAGWIWDIGLQSRRGTGHVFCSDYMSSDEAESILRTYIGDEKGKLNAKHIKMNCGYREKFWHKNCVAVGLSAAFVEPLEASAIFLIEASGNMIAELFPRNDRQMNRSAEKYNQSFHFRWQRTIDFIKMHYVLSKRQEPFWQANKLPKSIPQSLRLMLEDWHDRPVSKYDFEHVFEPFPQDSYQYVLNGMGFEVDALAYQFACHRDEVAKQCFAHVEQLKHKAQQQLQKNRQVLNAIRQYGIQKM
ncbi:tryptophan halogenase family protein [Pseudoalteromonas xiamenensis]